jgi:hypothetical protein
MTFRKYDRKVILQGKVSFHPVEKPGEFDLAVVEAKDRSRVGQTLLGVYEITNDNVLKLCFNVQQGVRPKAVEGKPGTGNFVYVLKRLKAKK